MNNHKSFLLLFLIAPVLSFAWGSEGHRIMASIAKDNLTKKTQDSVNHYLGGVSLEDASVWMDEMRSNRSYDYMKPFHYINIEKGENYSPTTKDNIINELNAVIDRLKNRNRYTAEETSTNLKILIHLVGDLHQPLHVGYGEDKGGNTTQVTFFGRGTNLHKLWDTEMIKRSGLTKEDCLKSMSSKSQREETQKPDVVRWMNECRTYLSSVYGYDDNRLSQEYLNKNLPIIEKQILLGGLRLANLLNDMF